MRHIQPTIEKLKAWLYKAYLKWTYKKISSSDAFCVLPWIHSHFFPSGHVHPCCIAGRSPMGDLNKKKFSAIWNSVHYRRIRRFMLSGRKPESCKSCYKLEEIGSASYRQSVNQKFAHHIKKIAETKKDGSYEINSFAYIDIRFSNICNFKCRTCGPHHSHLWNTDIPEDQGGGKPKILKLSHLENYPHDLVQNSLPEVEEIYFAGGEPLLAKEHYDILTHLIQQKRTDVRLLYSTNLAQIKYGPYDIAELWKHFTNIRVNVSLDGTHELGEYIRHGLKWPELLINLNTLKEKVPHVDFQTAMTVSVLNISQLVTSIEFLMKENIFNEKTIFLSLLQNPSHFSIQVLPASEKEVVAQQMDAFIEKYNSYDKSHYSNITIQVADIKNYMLAADLSHLQSKLREESEYLDKKRNENSSKFISWL